MIACADFRVFYTCHVCFCRYRLTGLSGKFVRPQKSMKYEEEPVYGFVRCFIHVAVVMHILCGL